MYETIKDFLTAGYDKKEFPLIANMLEKNGNYDSAPSGGTVTVLCDEDDSPIGIGIMLRTDAWIEEIAAFEIRKEFRGNGLGSGLLLKMLSDYRSEDMFVFVRALDAKAAAFYYRWMDSWFKVSFGKDDDNEIDYVVRNQKGTVENSIKVLRSCIADRNDENVKIKLFHPNGINKVGNSYKTIDRKYHEKKGDWDGSKLLCADNESTSPLPVSMLFVLNESIANSEKNESLGSAIRSTLAAGALAAGSFVPGTAFASGHGKSHASSNRPNIVY
jgi:GNAT superfamily N-acetyltransferase